MNKIISQGKTTTEAINNGLKELNVSRDMVDIKVIDEDNKRMFYSILSPRVVKVELTLKEVAKVPNQKRKEKKIIELSQEDFQKIKKELSDFIDDFIGTINNDIVYTIDYSDGYIKVDFQNDSIGYLIGYRGETLYAIQDLLVQIANKNSNTKVYIMLDINNYKEKRKKTLQELAIKKSKIVKSLKKDIRLEPMKPYERKIIHESLQDISGIYTYSVGEEPSRRLVISYQKT